MRGQQHGANRGKVAVTTLPVTFSRAWQWSPVQPLNQRVVGSSPTRGTLSSDFAVFYGVLGFTAYVLTVGAMILALVVLLRNLLLRNRSQIG